MDATCYPAILGLARSKGLNNVNDRFVYRLDNYSSEDYPRMDTSYLSKSNILNHYPDDYLFTIQVTNNWAHIVARLIECGPIDILRKQNGFYEGTIRLFDKDERGPAYCVGEIDMFIDWWDIFKLKDDFFRDPIDKELPISMEDIKPLKVYFSRGSVLIDQDFEEGCPVRFKELHFLRHRFEASNIELIPTGF